MPRSDQQRIIPGLLIEGVDFIGKSTVAKRLVDVLNSSGHDSKMRKCYISGAPLVDFLDQQAARTDSMLERDSYYSAAIVLDILLFRPLRTFLVQDRHWLSQTGRNLFFHPEQELLPPGLVERMHFPFQFNVLLTSNLETKIERSRDRPSKSPRDRYLREHPASHQEYEAFLMQLLPNDEHWVVLDTTGQTVDEVVESIRAFLGGPSLREASPVQALSAQRDR
jgi:thymidylate kinase